MAIPTDKRLVSFNANTEAWEAFKTKAYANGTDASALLNQMIQGYLDDAADDLNSRSARDSEFTAMVEKIRVRLEAVATKLDESAEQAGSTLPDLLALRDQTITRWTGPKRLRINQCVHVINAFIKRLEGAMGVGEGSYIQRLKSEVERVTALYKAKQENSARLAECYDAARRRLKVLGEDAW